MDRARSREKGQPLCMEQYYRLFTSYRYPGTERDSLVTSYTSGDEPEHVIVAYKNQVGLCKLNSFSVSFFVTGRYRVDNVFLQQ